MAENLNVDHYRNGDPIPEVKDPEQWKNLTSGAWCYYDNDPENGKKYCKLYNWYAVNDPRGLAPKGWHIPTRAEFKTLVATVNQDGNALKAIVQGRGDGAGINTSGFSILMAGRRDRKSNFSDLGEVACFWGSTENQNSTDYANYLHLTSDYVNYDYDQKDYGFSVRCMKNTNISPETVKIGDQEWMTENLNVDHYRNGDPIPEIQDSVLWKNLKMGAWCYYNNDPENSDKYGKLYNWYAVDDSRGLAPEGWHIPTQAELQTLVKNVNNNATELLAIGQGFGSNTVGFSALLAGYRYLTGDFNQPRENASFWSSSAVDHKQTVRIAVSPNQYKNFTNTLTIITYMRLIGNKINILSAEAGENFGFSIRCVKN
jgi:uncharacterized protein (TIGR02145 family)